MPEVSARISTRRFASVAPVSLRLEASGWESLRRVTTSIATSSGSSTPLAALALAASRSRFCEAV